MTSALIVGSGIAGSGAAIALKNVGITPVLIEKYATPATGVGAFLTLGSNGLAALEALGAGHLGGLGFATPTITLASGTGKVLGHSRVTGPSEMPTSRTMARSDLYAALRAEVESRGIATQTGKAFVSATDTDAGITARLSDGSEIQADMLIGCDGVQSAVRTSIDAQSPAPTFTGLIGHGGFAPSGVINGSAGDYRMIFGARSFFGYVIAPDGEVWWFVNEPAQHDKAKVESDPDMLRRHLIGLVANDAGPAVQLLEATTRFAPSSPIHTVPHLPHWQRRRQIVIGDAAHAPSPSSGQGASLALEDAVELARALKSAGSVQQAFAQFEASRRDRVESIITYAARTNSAKAATGVQRIIRDLMLPLILKATADAPALRETYGYDLRQPSDRPQAATSTRSAPAEPTDAAEES